MAKPSGLERLSELTRQAMAGRLDVLERFAGIPQAHCDGRHHECPWCGGSDRFRLIDANALAVFCNQCLNEKCGDGFAAIMKHQRCTFPEAVKLVADYLNISSKGTRKSTKAHATIEDAITSYRAWFVEKKPSITVDQRVLYWTYNGADGSPKLAIARYATNDGKEIRPFRLDPDGWRSGDPKGPLPLYNLPAIAAAEVLWWGEGEKVADALTEIGLVATTTAHGAGSAKRSDFQPAAGKRIIVVPDNDPAGERYAADVAAIAAKLSPPAQVSIRRIPGLGEGEDAFDFIEAQRRAGRTDEEIRA